MHRMHRSNSLHMSCSSNFVFCRKGNDYCRSRKMVATFMPMYFVSMIFVPVERIVVINIITSNYIWTKQTFPNHQSELFLDLWFNFKQSFDLSRWITVTYHFSALMPTKYLKIALMQILTLPLSE